MNIQPNFERVSEAFSTASQEIVRIPNVPSFDNGQRILEAIEALTRAVGSLRSDMISLRTDVNGLRTNMNGLQTDINGLRTETNGLRTDMNGRFELLELRMNAESVYCLL